MSVISQISSDAFMSLCQMGTAFSFSSPVNVLVRMYILFTYVYLSLNTVCSAQRDTLSANFMFYYQ